MPRRAAVAGAAFALYAVGAKGAYLEWPVYVGQMAQQPLSHLAAGAISRAHEQHSLQVIVLVDRVWSAMLDFRCGPVWPGFYCRCAVGVA